MNTLLKQAFGDTLEEILLQNIQDIAIYKSFEKGEVILDIGQSIFYIPLVLRGSVKILREDKDRGELLLYYLLAGETCTMTTTCCTSNKISSIRAIAETYTQVAFIPYAYFNSWLADYSSWRSFILTSYSKRLDEMIIAVDNLAFYNMEERVLNYLLQKKYIEQNRILEITHTQIANDLNSSRVVISRILKKLEIEDKIVLLRNEIRILI